MTYERFLREIQIFYTPNRESFLPQKFPTIRYTNGSHVPFGRAAVCSRSPTVVSYSDVYIRYVISTMGSVVYVVVCVVPHSVFLLCSDVSIFRELFHQLNHLTFHLLSEREREREREGGIEGRKEGKGEVERGEGGFSCETEEYIIAMRKYHTSMVFIRITLHTHTHTPCICLT